jgi:hypothetical protein
MIRIRPLALALGVGAMAVAPPPAGAQGSFLIETGNAFVRAHDWNGPLKYSTAWTRARPRDPMGWPQN